MSFFGILEHVWQELHIQSSYIRTVVNFQSCYPINRSYIAKSWFFLTFFFQVQWHDFRLVDRTDNLTNFVFIRVYSVTNIWCKMFIYTNPKTIFPKSCFWIRFMNIIIISWVKLWLSNYIKHFSTWYYSGIINSNFLMLFFCVFAVITLITSLMIFVLVISCWTKTFLDWR